MSARRGVAGRGVAGRDGAWRGGGGRASAARLCKGDERAEQLVHHAVQPLRGRQPSHQPAQRLRRRRVGRRAVGRWLGARRVLPEQSV